MTSNPGQEWKSPETAPKDKTFLGDFGYPWPLLTVWSDADKKWVCAELAASEDDGEYEHYFENQAFAADKIIGWKPMSEMANDRTNRPFW